MTRHFSFSVTLPILVKPFKDRIVTDGHNKSELWQMNGVVIPPGNIWLDTLRKMAKVVKSSATAIEKWQHFTSWCYSLAVQPAHQFVASLQIYIMSIFKTFQNCLWNVSIVKKLIFNQGLEVVQTYERIKETIENKQRRCDRVFFIPRILFHENSSHSTLVAWQSKRFQSFTQRRNVRTLLNV